MLDKNPMLGLGGTEVSGIGFLSGIESAEMDFYVPVSQAGSISRFTVFSRWRCFNTSKAAFAADDVGIDDVLAARRLTEVNPAIISWDAISVVDQVLWPAACHIEKSQSMKRVGLAPSKSGTQVAVVPQTSDAFPGAVTSPSNFSSEHPGLGIVMDEFEQLFVGEHDG